MIGYGLFVKNSQSIVHMASYSLLKSYCLKISVR